jgi:hypothetical protein
MACLSIATLKTTPKTLIPRGLKHKYKQTPFGMGLESGGIPVAFF